MIARGYRTFLTGQRSSVRKMADDVVSKLLRTKRKTCNRG